MTVHILGGRVGDNVSAPLKGTTVDRSGEGVVDNQGHTVLMRNACKFLDVENLTTRIGNGFAKQSLGVRTESSRDFLFRGFLRYEGTLDT